MASAWEVPRAVAKAETWVSVWALMWVCGLVWMWDKGLGEWTMAVVWDFQSVARTDATWTGTEKELLWGCLSLLLPVTASMRKLQLKSKQEKNNSVEARQSADRVEEPTESGDFATIFWAELTPKK